MLSMRDWPRNSCRRLNPLSPKSRIRLPTDCEEKKNRLYPVEAIREIVINALVHRDWTRSADIEFGLYEDRLEVISPGGLHNSMTLKK